MARQPVSNNPPVAGNRLTATRPDSLIGVYGGAFDPVHLGHQAIAAAALSGLQLDKLLWMPTGNPKHRAPLSVNAQHRLEMLRLAIEAEPRFIINDSEITSSEPSYTVSSLKRLQGQNPEAALVLILGADAYAGLDRWYRAPDLPLLAHLAIAARPGFELADDSPDVANLYRQAESAQALRQDFAGLRLTLKAPLLDISATAIRATIAGDSSRRHELSSAVWAYIKQHQLYTEK